MVGSKLWCSCSEARGGLPAAADASSVRARLARLIMQGFWGHRSAVERVVAANVLPLHGCQSWKSTSVLSVQFAPTQLWLQVLACHAFCFALMADTLAMVPFEGDAAATWKSVSDSAAYQPC